LAFNYRFIYVNFVKAPDSNLILKLPYYIRIPKESPAFPVYTLLLQTTHTRAHEPALANLPNPILIYFYHNCTQSEQRSKITIQSI